MAIPPGNLPLCTHRYLLMTSYLGSKYNGSQRLSSRDEPSTQNTVQETLEWSLEQFLPKKRCKLTASSRTDKGVHASMNCFTLPLMDFEMPTEWMRRTMNRNLVKNNHDINVNDVVLVSSDFHPRRNTIGREYIYRLAVFDNPIYSKLCKKHRPRDILHLLPITELYRALPLTCFNYGKAQEAIDIFNGEHDFASFAIKQENILDTVRNIKITITRLNSHSIDFALPHSYSLYQIHFKSRAFLYNQIRRMVGAILNYASYNTIELERIKFMLDNPDSRNWNSNMIIAEPWGLFLSRIIYGRSSFAGAMKTFEDKTEIRIDEFNLPSTIGITDDETKVQNFSQTTETEQIP